MNLPQSLQNKIAHGVDLIYDRFQCALAEIFYGLRNNIAQRKLYVMFEDMLLCNVESDHLVPKSVLPVFSSFLSAAEDDIRKASYAHLVDGMAVFERSILEKEAAEREELQQCLDDLQMRYSREVSISVQASANFDELETKQQKLEEKLLQLEQEKRENQISEGRFGEVFEADAELGTLESTKKLSAEERLRITEAQFETIKFKLGKAEHSLLAQSKQHAATVTKMTAENDKMQQRINELEEELAKTSEQVSTRDDDSPAVEQVRNDSLEAADFEDAKKVIRYLRETLYDKDELCQKLAEKLMIKNRMITLSVGVASEFGRMSGASQEEQRLGTATVEEDEEKVMEQQFTQLARLQLELNEIKSQNCELRVALKDEQDLNEKVFTEAVLQPEFVPDGYSEFINGNDNISELVKGSVRGNRSIESIIKQDAASSEAAGDRQALFDHQGESKQEAEEDALVEQEHSELVVLQVENVKLKEELYKFENVAKFADEQRNQINNVTSNERNKESINATVKQSEVERDEPIEQQGERPGKFQLPKQSPVPTEGLLQGSANTVEPLTTRQRHETPSGLETLSTTMEEVQTALSCAEEDGQFVSGASNDPKSDRDMSSRTTQDTQLASFSLLNTTSDGHTPQNNRENAAVNESEESQGFRRILSENMTSVDENDAQSEGDGLFMLNEDLMCTIEFGDEMDGDEIDRQLEYLETRVGYQGQPERSESTAAVKGSSGWEKRYLKLLQIFKRQKQRIETLKCEFFGEHEELADLKQAEPDSGGLPVSASAIVGELVIPEQFKQSVLEKYRSLVLSNGTIVIMTPATIGQVELAAITTQAKQIGADLLLNPGISELQDLITQYIGMCGIDELYEQFESADEAFDWLAHEINANLAQPAKEESDCANAHEKAGANNADAEQQATINESASPRDSMLSDRSAEKELQNRKTPAVNKLSAPFEYKGAKLDSTMVKDVLQYIENVFEIDMNRPREQVRQQLVQNVTKLLKEQESSTATHKEEITDLQARLSEVQLAEAEFRHLLSEFASVAVQTNAEVCVRDTEQQRCELACLKLAQRYKRVSLPEHCTQVEDVFTRLYNEARRLQRKIEYAENKYLHSQLRTFSIISLELQLRREQHRQVKPVLQRPDGRDYNIRGKILEAAALPKDLKDASRFSIGVKPLK